MLETKQVGEEFDYETGRKYCLWQEDSPKIDHTSLKSLPSAEQETCITRMRRDVLEIYSSDTTEIRKLMKKPYIVVKRLTLGSNGRILYVMCKTDFRYTLKGYKTAEN